MSNIAAILKEEIARLARRETRAITRSLQRNSVKLRHDAVALKRQTALLHSELAKFKKTREADVSSADNTVETTTARFGARSVRAQRKRLGLSAFDYGRLVGVTAHSVYKWEHGTARPRKFQLEAIARLRDIGKKDALERLTQLTRKERKRPKSRERRT